MFERFTPRARRVIVLAQDAAREMGHAQIKPEHLLVALRQGDGMAANAMAQAGVDATALRQRVAGLYQSKPPAKKLRKVPFAAEAKKCLEEALRAALGLRHNYIGTEHLFFGVQRQAEASDRSLDELLGVSAGEIARRLTEMLNGAVFSASMHSPAVQAALERARAGAGHSAVTTGHVLAGILSDADSQASRALAGIGADPQRVQAALDAVNVAETSDATPSPQGVTITVGDTTTVIGDAGVAAALRRLSPDQLRDAIKGAVDWPHPGQAAG